MACVCLLTPQQLQNAFFVFPSSPPPTPIFIFFYLKNYWRTIIIIKTHNFIIKPEVFFCIVITNTFIILRFLNKSFNNLQLNYPLTWPIQICIPIHTSFLVNPFNSLISLEILPTKQKRRKIYRHLRCSVLLWKEKEAPNHIAFHFHFFDLSEANPVRNQGEKWDLINTSTLRLNLALLLNDKLFILWSANN